MPWTDDVALELEALHATYGDELHVNEDNQIVSMLLTPSSSAPESYLQCQLELRIPEQYPEAAAPNIAIQETKGLGSSRLAALENHLHHEASQSAGEMMLGQLYECAKDWLHKHNWPEGPCIFCLEDLSPNRTTTSSSSSSISNSSGSSPQYVAQPCMRLPCFHAFHRSCFTDWWCWQQQALLEQQQQLEQRTGATAAAALLQEQLPAKEGGHFQLNCPSCRTDFSLQQDLQHMLEQLQQNLQQQQQAPVQAPTLRDHISSSSSSQHRLTADELAPWRDIQQRHAALFAAQQKRNGIITDAKYSIADWDAAAAAAAAAEQAATARDRSSSTSSSTNSSGSNMQVLSSPKYMQGHMQGQQQLPTLHHAHEHCTNNNSVSRGYGVTGGGSSTGARRGGGDLGTSSGGSRHSRGGGRGFGSVDRARPAPMQEHAHLQTGSSRNGCSSRGRGRERGRGRSRDGASSGVHDIGTGPVVQQWAVKDDSSRHDNHSGRVGNHRGRGRGGGRRQHISVITGQ